MSSSSLNLPDPDCVEHVYRGTGRDRPRYYRHKTEGWEYPGVTTLLSAWDKGGLIDWSARIEREACLLAAEEYYAELAEACRSTASFGAEVEQRLGEARQHVKAKEKGGDLGTAVHDAIHTFLKAQIAGRQTTPAVILSPEAQTSLDAWHKHFVSSGIVPLRMEQPVWSHRYKYAGTLDLLAVRDGKLGICDWKTSKWWINSFHLQVEAYCRATDERLSDVERGGGPPGPVIEWAELWKLPKTAEQQFEVRELGHCDEWVEGRPRICKPRPQSRGQLFESFLGIAQGWKNLCEPSA